MNKNIKYIKVIAIIVSSVLCVMTSCLLIYASYNIWGTNENEDLTNKVTFDVRSRITTYGWNQTVNDGVITEGGKQYFDDVIINSGNATNTTQFLLARSRIMYYQPLAVNYGQKISFIAAMNDTADKGGEVEIAGSKFYMSINEFDTNGYIVSDGNWMQMNETYTIGQSTSYWSENRSRVKYIIPIFRWNSGDTASGAGTDMDITTRQLLNVFDIFKIICSDFNYTFNYNGGKVGNSTATTMKRLGVTDVSIPTTPTKPGYTFAGWKITSTGGKQTGKVYTESQLTTMFNDSKYYSSLFEDAVFEAQWQPNTYTINYNTNGGIGNIPEQTCTFDKNYTLSNGTGFSRTGYTLTGWVYNKNAYKLSQSVSNLTETANTSVTMYADWKANNYTIKFDGNGGTGAMSDLNLAYDQKVTLPQNQFVNTTEQGDSKFVGWLDKNSNIVYQDMQEVKNLTASQNGIVILYAQWDNCPVIEAVNRYYTLEEAQNGKITQESLLETVTAADDEDGDISGNVIVKDYFASEWPQFNSSGSSLVKYEVTDSSGNKNIKDITVYIVDTAAQEVKDTTNVRFISPKYYKLSEEEGGLAENSIWKTNPDYAQVLEAAMQNILSLKYEEINTTILGVPIHIVKPGSIYQDHLVQQWVFVHEDIKKVKEYVNTHGIGNSKEPDALSNFIHQFSYCRKK